MVGLLNLAKAAGNIPAPKPSNDLLRAFHGSPHDFDKFSTAQIGTGEGAQAYGRGLYFAESEDVAKGYRNRISEERAEFFDPSLKDDYEIGRDINNIWKLYDKESGFVDADMPAFRNEAEATEFLKSGKLTGDLGFSRTRNKTQQQLEKNGFDSYVAEDVADRVALDLLQGSSQADRRKTRNFFKNNNDIIDEDGINVIDDVTRKATVQALDFVDSIKVKNKKGRMYQVDIDASLDELLDYDAPLSEQSDAVRSALDEYSGNWTKENYGLPWLPSGEQRLKHMASSPAGAEALSKAGIKGIRYKDGFSRGTDGGSSNYVIFDDRLISISKKYGISIPAAAAMLQQSEEAEAGPIAAGARRIIDPRFSQPIGGGAVRKGLIDPMGTLSAEVTPRDIDTGPSFQLSDFEGQPYIISQSDRSAAGGILNAVGGTQIDPVDLRGGRDFMFENPGMAWASDPKVVNSLLERATKLKEGSGQNPLLLPYTMAPTGIDFATMPLDTMINFARSNMSKTNIKKLDRQIKKIIPKWGGVANPTSNAIFRDSTGDQRKMVADVIDKQFKGAKGGLSIAEARAVTSDANQYLSNDGSMVNIGRIDTSRPAIADSGHPTYKGGLPGEGVGTFQEPLDIRKFIANNGRVVTNKPNDIRAASMNPALTQGIIDEKLLRAQEGSIDPRLLGGIAATSAAAPTLADQGAGIMDFLANAAQGAVAPISNAPNTIIQALTSDRSNEQLKADRDARLAANDYQLRTDLGQQYTQQAQQTMGGLIQYLQQQAEQSKILDAVKNSRILQTIPNAYNQIPERGRIVGNALLDSFL